MSLWWILKVMPKNLLSRLVGLLAGFKLPPPLKDWVLKWFARRYRINLGEAEWPIEKYRTVQELFTRKLKPCLRPIASEALVHPVDGTRTVVGDLKKGDLFQAKGLHYSLTDFLRDPELAGELSGGWYATYYLCPTDYHRVHSAWDGQLSEIVHIPGTLWPVNPWSVTNVPKLFAINERLLFVFQTQWGKAILAMVGATNVGEMTTSWAPGLITNRARVPQRRPFNPPVAIHKGDELGVFNLGSTVVILLPEPARGLLLSDSFTHESKGVLLGAAAIESL